MEQFLQYSPQPQPPPAPIHSPKETFHCLWNGVYGLRCNALFCGKDLSAHLREAHQIHGADKSRLYCRWDRCNLELNKESLARHIEEKHLGIVYHCDTCWKTFSRKDTLKRHKDACSM